MNPDTKIYVPGHRGLVGSAVTRRLKELGYANVVVKDRSELDLLDGAAVRAFFDAERPACVVACAARVGGIKANLTYPAEFLYENLQIQNNLIWSAKAVGADRFLFLGSSCVYPRDCAQPMKEDYLLSGKPERTNEAYAVAKIAGIKLCDYLRTQYGSNFTSVMPTNIYGSDDNFDPDTSHVIPALLRRMHEAKDASGALTVWGTGNSRREFMHVEDLADAIVWILKQDNVDSLINIGTGRDVSIRELAELIRRVVGYKGKLVYDATKPDGMPRKLLDVTRLNETGWKHKIDLEEGIRRTYESYCARREAELRE